ncbi:CUB domain protein [Necator americanus]|uniref:CUB domain protein n=1 Tax=Necator americanus TaxID=51031 RepID=W2TH68_NECAM|nr:CUB domain protein [Necator americanus]ETN81395.1 CUB domain protein [Necator americanus]
MIGPKFMFAQWGPRTTSLCSLAFGLQGTQCFHLSVTRAVINNPINSGKLAYTGCPENNDFYYEGVISSPYYPNQYPPNTECYYYITAEPGKLLRFNFTHFDLESCCDYVTIYDGRDQRSPKLVHLKVSADYALAWAADDVPDNQKLTQTILGMTKYIPDVTQNNKTDLSCIFQYAQLDVGPDSSENMEREGISKVVIAFVPQNPNDDQDFFEAKEFAHTIHNVDDTKLIVVAMGRNLDVPRLGQLSYGSGFTLSADYDSLSSLVPALNKAICADLSTSCGA